MKQEKILLMCIVLSIAMAGAVYADSYCFLKLGNGESVPVSSLTDRYTCHLSSGRGFCQVCTNSSGWYASWNRCYESCADSEAGNGVNLTLTANFPFADEGVFTKQSFFLDISTNKVSSIYLIDNIKGTQRNLCPNCMSYKKSAAFQQGANDITIRAVNGNEIVEKRMRFTIDNRKPVISRILPVSNRFASGFFTVVYDEDNIEEVKLNYGVSGNMKSVSLTGCDNGRKKNCSAEAALGEFDGKQINYWFEIRDIANNLVSSRATKVNVDISKPVITSFSYSVDRSYISINMSASDTNLYRVEYTDNNENSPRLKVLCSSLPKGKCIKRISFRGDSPDIVLKVSDKAGNFEEVSIQD